IANGMLPDAKFGDHSASSAPAIGIGVRAGCPSLVAIFNVSFASATVPPPAGLKTSSSTPPNAPEFFEYAQYTLAPPSLTFGFGFGLAVTPTAAKSAAVRTHIVAPDFGAAFACGAAAAAGAEVSIAVARSSAATIRPPAAVNDASARSRC